VTPARTSRDGGSGSVLLVAIVAVLAAVGAGLGLLGQAAVARHRAEAAADLAALAAADALLGRAAGEPCRRASRAAAANQARVTDCRPGPGSDVVVSVEVDAGGGLRRLGAGLGTARASARAGPVP
jgi:secretion/DNA translocation related TadE-like protein